MDLELTVTAEPGDAAQELVSLQQWLRSEPALAGLVSPRTAVAPPGAMGVGIDALLVAIGPESAVTVLVAGLVSWLTRRRGRPDAAVTVRVTRPDGGTLEVSSSQVQALTPEELRTQVDQLATILLAEPDRS